MHGGYILVKYMGQDNIMFHAVLHIYNIVACKIATHALIPLHKDAVVCGLKGLIMFLVLECSLNLSVSLLMQYHLMYRRFIVSIIIVFY